MQMYSAFVEVAIRDYDTETVLERLTQFHASIGQSARGWGSAQISLPGESTAQAAATACAVVGVAFGADAVACEVMTETEFNAREGWKTVPELVSVTEAAELLGVSRQAVLQRIDAKTLPATRVGRDYVIARQAVVASSSS